MKSPKTWNPCLADQNIDLAFFDEVRINTDRITDPRWDRVLPILEEEQVLMCRMMANVIKTKPGARVLDIGTGSGVFAIYAAKLGCKVIAIDISDRALRFARQNAQANNISITDTEPKSKEIQYIKSSYEHIKDNGTYDIVIIAAPYNPTCDGFNPALHAKAGPLGQDYFEEQLPHAARLLKPTGVCIGNQMVVVNKDGSFAAKELLQQNFPGGRFDYLRILPEEEPVERFLHKQYITYLKKELNLKPSETEVAEYIKKYSSDHSFALLYFELSYDQQNSAKNKNIIELVEYHSTVRPKKTWADRISLHRHIIEHTAHADSFPSPALFLDIDALPNFPSHQQDPASDLPGSNWNSSVLRYVDSWLAKTGLLDKDTGQLDLLLVDTAPWYPTPDGRKSLMQEAAVWLAPTVGSPTTATNFTSQYQKNTRRLQETYIGPFLHPHFTGRNRPEEWRDIQFTVHEIHNEKQSRQETCQGILINELIAQIETNSIGTQNNDFSVIETPPSLLGCKYTSAPLSSLEVKSGDLLGYNTQVDIRIKRLLELSPELKPQDKETLCSIDLNICHQAMHQRLDSIGRKAGISANGPSTLVGIPVSLATIDTASSSLTLPKNYRGGIWIYAIARGEWRIENERYLLDLARLLSMLYESQYSAKASKELRSIGFNTAQYNWTHETKNLILALKRFPQPPASFNYSTTDKNMEDFAIIPFSSLFNAGLTHLKTWVMAESISDLPFYTTGDSLPANLETLINESFKCAIDVCLFRLLRSQTINQKSYLDLKSHIEKIKVITPKLSLTGANGVLAMSIDWQNKNSFWLHFSRLLLCEFREALQHGNWKEGINIDIEGMDGHLEKIIFKNTKRDMCFSSNITNAPTNKNFKTNKVESAFTCGSRNGDGLNVRENIAHSLNAHIKMPTTKDNTFIIEYIID